MALFYRLSTRALAVLILALTGSLSSCEKDELTKPAEVYFQFKLDREAPGNESLTFQQGTMDIQAISFTGDRQSGEDITFVSDFGTVVHADLGTGNTDPVIKFDIPQGTYSEISLQVDPDNILPDLVVSGRYIPALIGPPVPVQLEITMPAELRLIAKNPDGSPHIVINRDSKTTVEIFLNPSRWLTEIPLLSLETADLQNISGVPSILISQEFNQDLYSKLEGRIQSSAEAIFK